MMTANRPTDQAAPAPTYSPARLKLLLRLLPYMAPGDSHLPLPPELAHLPHQLGYRSWPTAAECDYYSLKAALDWLYQREPRAELVIRLGYCVGMSTRDIADAFRARGLVVSHMTVYRWSEDGIELMAWHLGWRRS